MITLKVPNYLLCKCQASTIPCRTNVNSLQIHLTKTVLSVSCNSLWQHIQLPFGWKVVPLLFNRIQPCSLPQSTILWHQTVTPCLLFSPLTISPHSAPSETLYPHLNIHPPLYFNQSLTLVTQLHPYQQSHLNPPFSTSMENSHLCNSSPNTPPPIPNNQNK